MGNIIHSTAIVDTKAIIGTEVEIGPYSVIGPNVKIGDRCRIASHVVIDGYTTIGSECEIFPFASIGTIPQDLKYRGEASTLVIGSRNKIREYVTLQPGTAGATMTTIIGDKNLFMVGVHVGHDSVVGDSNVIANYTALAGHVTVGSNTVISAQVAVHQFVRVADFAFVSGGSMVEKDMPPYLIGQGDRCRLRGVNVVGLQRAGISDPEISEIRRVYRALFGSIGRYEEKFLALSEELRQRPLIKKQYDFIMSSQRGICPPAKKLTHP